MAVYFFGLNRIFCTVLFVDLELQTISIERYYGNWTEIMSTLRMKYRAQFFYQWKALARKQFRHYLLSVLLTIYHILNTLNRVETKLNFNTNQDQTHYSSFGLVWFWPWVVEKKAINQFRFEIFGLCVQTDGRHFSRI